MNRLVLIHHPPVDQALECHTLAIVFGHQHQQLHQRMAVVERCKAQAAQAGDPPGAVAHAPFAQQHTLPQIKHAPLRQQLALADLQLGARDQDPDARPIWRDDQFRDRLLKLERLGMRRRIENAGDKGRGPRDGMAFFKRRACSAIAIDQRQNRFDGWLERRIEADDFDHPA